MEKDINTKTLFYTGRQQPKLSNHNLFCILHVILPVLLSFIKCQICFQQVNFTLDSSTTRTFKAFVLPH